MVDMQQSDSAKISNKVLADRMKQLEQGKEFVTMCKEIERFEKEASGKFGHLRSANRLNVAMSRQRRFLLALGDAEMYRGASAMQAVPEMSAFLELCESEAIRVA